MSTQGMSDLTTIAWMQAKPGTKLHAELTKAAAKKSKTPAQKLQAAITRAEKKISDTQAHITWCAEHEQQAEVERWSPWILQMQAWVIEQRQKLEAMGE